jgi:hypothetical protein
MRLYGVSFEYLKGEPEDLPENETPVPQPEPAVTAK